ncbi:MAG: glycosyltransferase family 2 protein [Phycisphaerales bacterium]|nr:glycosyltransferase family 2 protein [Phycisphaerales bacterium]
MPTLLVSFVIATYNRGSVLADCLRRVLANGLPRSQFEILIVDNASTDGTPELVAREVPEAILIRLSKNCGPVAKNVAIRQARGEFVVLLDDDAFPHPGSVPQMVRHFHNDKNLAAAVFDVTLPDGTKESSAYPDVFIGAGTGIRKSILDQMGGGGLFPVDFFMQAEEYDLSFRILAAGGSVQRFWDLPLTHLKSPNARIAHRTTRFDIRNNLYLLAKYVPEPFCHQLAADWLSRYFMMAVQRDSQQSASSVPVLRGGVGTHKQSFIQGAAQGLAEWSARRVNGKHLLPDAVIERIFKFEQIKSRMARAADCVAGGGGMGGGRRIIFADLGKNMLAYYLAAKYLGLEILAIADDYLAAPPLPLSHSPHPPLPDYRGIPILPVSRIPWRDADLVIVSNLSPVHAPLRAAALNRTCPIPTVDLFSRHDPLFQNAYTLAERP